MWDEELPKKLERIVPRKLEGLSNDDLKDYLMFLAEERTRTEAELKRKAEAGAAAAQFFKH